MSESTERVGLIEDMSSNDYHSHKGSWSSSQLKEMLKDPEYFHKLYILKTEKKENIPAFDIGTYFHTAILEPHKLTTECAVYEGVRNGRKWEEFQEANKGKAIITGSDYTKAKNLINAVKDSPIAMNRLARGRPEISAFVYIIVYGGDVYSDDGSQILKRDGWVKSKSKPPKKGSVRILIKVRADLLGNDTFILDLKSMSGNAKDKAVIVNRVKDYTYDLSASLYLDMFTIATGKLYSDFIFTFASKDMGNSRSYMATRELIIVGREKWKKAVIALAHFIDKGWVFEDYLDFVNPHYTDLNYLKDKVEDLL